MADRENRLRAQDEREALDILAEFVERTRRWEQREDFIDMGIARLCEVRDEAAAFLARVGRVQPPDIIPGEPVPAWVPATAFFRIRDSEGTFIRARDGYMRVNANKPGSGVGFTAARWATDAEVEKLPKEASDG